MPHYVGLDVSQKTTAICIFDEQGLADVDADHRQ